MYRYCEEHGVPYKKLGKFIVATNPRQIATLERLMVRFSRAAIVAGSQNLIVEGFSGKRKKGRPTA